VIVTFATNSCTTGVPGIGTNSSTGVGSAGSNGVAMPNLQIN